MKKSKETEKKISARLPKLVDLVSDKGRPIYLFLLDDGLVTTDEINETVPPKREQIPFALVEAEEVKRRFRDDNDEELFAAVDRYLRRFAHLSDDQRLILTAYVFASYIQDHKDVQYLPIIYLYAVHERGKTRAGQAAIYLMYRGLHMVDIREANVFRHAEYFAASIFFDLMDVGKKLDRNDSHDVILHRCEKGAIVTRTNPDKPPFQDQKNYQVYGPTILASNEAVHAILESRCLPISMANRPGRYEKPTPDKAADLKARLTAWRARSMFRELPTIDYPEISGRLWDITDPLFRVCALVSPGRLEALRQAVINIDIAKKEEAQSTLEGRIVKAIIDLSIDPVGAGAPDWTIAIQDITDALNQGRPDNYKIGNERVGRKVKAMSIPRVRTGARRYAAMTVEIYEILLQQYGFMHTSCKSGTTVTTGMGGTEDPDNAGDSANDGSVTDCDGSQTVIRTVTPQGADMTSEKRDMTDMTDLRNTGAHPPIRKIEVKIQ